MNTAKTKNVIRALLVAVVLLGAYHLLAFLIPFQHNEVFWIGYGFGLAAILLQIPVLTVAFYGAKLPMSKYYGTPIARIALYYLIAQMILSFIAMALSFVGGFPTWPLWLIFALGLGAAILGVVGADATRDEIIRQDKAVKTNSAQMQSLRIKADGLAGRCPNQALAGELRKLSEDLRYSDPIGSPATAEYEQHMGELLDYLGNAIYNPQQTADALNACATFRSMLAERNQICRLNKQ